MALNIHRSKPADLWQIGRPSSKEAGFSAHERENLAKAQAFRQYEQKGNKCHLLRASR